MRIENSVTRVTASCMPNSYPEWRKFQFASNNHYKFFFLHTLPSTTVINYALFYQFCVKISTFSIKKCSVQLPSTTSWRHARGRLTPPRVQKGYARKLAVQGLKVCKEEVGNAYVIQRQTWRMICLCSYNLTNIKFFIGKDNESNVEWKKGKKMINI